MSSDLFPIFESDEGDGPVTRAVRQISSGNATPADGEDRERLAVRIVLAQHERSLGVISRLTNAVITAVLVGSLSVIGTVISSVWYLSARMERLENVTVRVDHIERLLEAGRP